MRPKCWNVDAESGCCACPVCEFHTGKRSGWKWDCVMGPELCFTPFTTVGTLRQSYCFS